ncbi:MAG: FAD-binding protein [Planctomycetes bacterium]|nr:FAD-binding protein [Planctomycetota bacterium]
MSVAQQIINFGGNIRFTPERLYTPSSDAEVLTILDRHAHGKIRVVGSLHAWSPLVPSDEALVDLRHFDRVEVDRDADGVVWATVGGGCKIKHLLRKLHRMSDSTIPSLGLITEQTIAGAISTATHGSGKQSLSHYMAELRVAAYDANGRAHIYTWNDGSELRAARCALGCMGIILSVKFRCVPKYEIAEIVQPCATIDEVLAGEEEFPLQQFYLGPHLWSYFAQRRVATAEFHPRRSLSAKLYRAYWFFGIDVGLHLVIKTLTMLPAGWIRFFYRHVLAKVVLMNVRFVDHSERMLVMEHELFKHLEIEIFVPARHVRAAAAFVEDVLKVFDGDGPTPLTLQSIGMADELEKLRGTFTHHYPITFRRVLHDDALIAMSSGDEPYYAISFITYVEPRKPFFAMASFLAHSMARLFDARPHWGKYFPLDHADVERVYPNLSQFRAICRRVDPYGVFCNAFTDRVLFGIE